MYMLGIALGLMCAAGSSSAYLCSRIYALRHAKNRSEEAPWRGPLRLLVCAHIYLGLICAVATIMLWPQAAHAPADLPRALLICAGVAIFYMAGNSLLFFALQRTDASRVAPLLGFKVVLLAMVLRFAFDEPLATQQWIAVLLATTAALMLGATGGRVPIRAAALVVGACLGFMLSDVCISRMVPALLPASIDLNAASHPQRVRASLTGMAIVYCLCAVTALALLPLARPRSRADWAAAVPYTLSWLIAMTCLFACFSIVGVVLGNILQSTRGLMSIGLGVLIARLGHHHLESHASWPVIIRRIFAAAIMSTAIGLYVTAEINPKKESSAQKAELQNDQEIDTRGLTHE